MATLVINTGRVPQQVGVIDANGKKATVRVMGRGRGELGPDVKIDPNWMALNGKYIKLVETSTVAVAKTAITNSSAALKPKTQQAVAKTPQVTVTAQTVASSTGSK